MHLWIQKFPRGLYPRTLIKKGKGGREGEEVLGKGRDAGRVGRDEREGNGEGGNGRGRKRRAGRRGRKGRENRINLIGPQYLWQVYAAVNCPTGSGVVVEFWSRLTANHWAKYGPRSRLTHIYCNFIRSLYFTYIRTTQGEVGKL
jgi:hypothetical protein